MVASCCNELRGYGSYSGNRASVGRVGNWPCMDNAASATIVDHDGNYDGTLSDGNSSTYSVSGPTGWLTRWLDLDGARQINLPSGARDEVRGAAALTVLCRVNLDSASNRVIAAAFLNSGNGTFLLRANTALQFYVNSTTQAGGTVSPSLSTGVDYSLAARYDGAEIASFFSGTKQSPTIADTGSLATGLQALVIGGGYGIAPQLDGRIGNFALYNRAGGLSDSEIADDADDPEPVYISGSDTVTGTPQDGETLSVSSDVVYGLPSPFSGGTNGSITYSYQWTASDDGSGTGEANISGATGATFTATSAEVGKYLRRWRRASNTGGFDPAEDLASDFSGVIASSGGVGGSLTRSKLLTNGLLIGGRIAL